MVGVRASGITPYANSGIVVPVEPADYKQFASAGALAGLRYQQYVEQAVCKAGGGTQTAPAQRLADLIEGKISTDLPTNSYQPGTVSRQLSEVLPKAMHQRLKFGFKDFGNKMRGYLTNEAVAVAVESRTSSPVRIPRNELGEHPQIKGLFPVRGGWRLRGRNCICCNRWRSSYGALSVKQAYSWSARSCQPRCRPAFHSCALFLFLFLSEEQNQLHRLHNSR